MLVLIEENRMGDIEISPVSERIRRKYAKAMQEWSPYSEGTAYLQGQAADEFKALDLTPRQRRDMSGGWPIRVRMDPYNYGMLLGYDMCHLEVYGSNFKGDQ